MTALLYAGLALAAGSSNEGTGRLEPPGVVRVEAGIGGTTGYELGALAGLRVGVTPRLQLGANLAHAALGVVNGHAKVGLFDQGAHSASLSAGVLWLDLGRAYWLPAIQPDVDQALRGVDLVMLPVSVTWTREGSQLGIDLTAGWDHAWIVGRPSSEVVILDGALGVRRAWVAPALRVPLSEAFVLGARGTLPLLAMGRTVATAEVLVQDGVVAGVRSSEWFRLPLGETTSARLYLEWSSGRSSLRVGAATAALPRAAGVPCLPYVLWSRRFRG